MKFKSKTKFHIRGLNQEKVFNELSKTIPIFDINRKSKDETTFKCDYFDYKKVERVIKDKKIEIVKIRHEGIFYKIKLLLTSYGVIAAIIFSSLFYFWQNRFILQYEILGTHYLSESEVLDYLKDNFSKNINKIDTENIEVSILDRFYQVSFVSCMIKGQTLVVSIKEKLLPNEIYGQFKPIVAKKSGKITKIDLVSGTCVVKVGDFVKAGDLLVEPYTVDTAGQIRKVEAKAEIEAEVYNLGSIDHYASFIEVKRTGRVSQENNITLFGLSIYKFRDKEEFEKYEVEVEEIPLIKNLVLPFKIKKTRYYELSEKLIESNFEDVKEEYIEKARQKALENCENCDKIIDEYYTLRHLSGVTIVNYCVVSAEEIGGY